MLNGELNFDDASILICAQGDENPAHLSGVVQVPFLADEPEARQSLSASTAVVPSSCGRPFNSVNIIIVYPHDH